MTLKRQQSLTFIETPNVLDRCRVVLMHTPLNKMLPDVFHFLKEQDEEKRERVVSGPMIRQEAVWLAERNNRGEAVLPFFVLYLFCVVFLSTLEQTLKDKRES